MRIYHRSQEDKINSINNRCFFDAQHGRVSLALERIRDIAEEFPKDAQVTYAEGLIRKDYLGQGAKAWALFEKAYKLDNKHAFAACNACIYAPTEEKFRIWADISMKVSPDDPQFSQLVNNVQNSLNEGISYWQILLQVSQLHFEAKNFGESAAFAELVLLADEMPPTQEVANRRTRAQLLRYLDAEAHRYRETLLESFLPEERLSLQEALIEIDKALSLDEYDAELWNLKSAWCCLMGQYEEAILCADRSIKLRPFSYPKPYHNKANALRCLKRDSEALTCAEESLEQAEAGNSISDVSLSHKIIEEYSRPRSILTLKSMEPIIYHIIKATRITADLELGQQSKGSNNLEILTKGFFTRSASLFSHRTVDYIPLMAEFLNDFTPDTAFCIVLKTSELSQEIHDHCLHAVLYILAHSNGVMQRDAARFLALTILSAMEATLIRKAYREAVLEPSAAATDEMSQLDAILRKELRFMNSLFPELISDQEPVDEDGRQRSVRNILSRFVDVPDILSKYANKRFDFAGLRGEGHGCTPVVIALMVIIMFLLNFTGC
ncbi:MAG: hypothetical protein K8T10_14685 [Candidatus Eremiobacteraeota bacterium]|nr:hypothetical protein [Candidatus Eremiobacteraeota bacterium]